MFENKTDSTFKIKKWEETPIIKTEVSPKLSRADVIMKYSGDIDGESNIIYLITDITDLKATIIGIEHFLGKINGHEGSFLIEQDGTYEEGVFKASGVVIPGSGSGGLEGLEGESQYSMKQGKVTFKFNYKL